MDRIRITGGQKLTGVIPVSGAKNAALPLMIASLLTPETLTLENVPRLADVRMLMRILEQSRRRSRHRRQAPRRFAERRPDDPFLGEEHRRHDRAL